MLTQVLKRAGGLVAVVLLVQGGFGSLEAQGYKIAVVDIELAFAQSTAGQALQGQIAQLEESTKTTLEQMNQEREELRKRAVDGGQTLSQEKLEELQAQFDQKTIEMRRFQEDKQKEGQKVLDDAQRDFLRRVRPVIQALRDQESYDLILRKEVVLIASDSIDVTSVVVERLNAADSGG